MTDTMIIRILHSGNSRVVDEIFRINEVTLQNNKKPEVGSLYYGGGWRVSLFRPVVRASGPVRLGE